MALSPKDNPAELFHPRAEAPSLSLLLDPNFGWCAVQTYANKEKALASYLRDNNIPYFLPLVRSITPGSKNRNRIYKPLFAGILFMCHIEKPLSDAKGVNKGVDATLSASIARLDSARATRYVYGYLFTKDQRRLRSELAFLNSEIPDSRSLRAEEAHPIGTRVRILPGHPFSNQHAILLASTSQEQSRIQIRLSFLGRDVSLEIAITQLELLEPQRRH